MSHHPAFKLAMSLQGLLSQGNWSSFFQQTLKAPYLLAALAHLYFPALRLHALRVLSRTLAGETPRIHCDLLEAQLQTSLPTTSAAEFGRPNH